MNENERESQRQRNKADLNSQVKVLRDSLSRLLRRVRSVQRRAHAQYQEGLFHGGRLRELEDTEHYLLDARDSYSQFLKEK